MRDTAPEVVIADIRTPPTQTWGRAGGRALDSLRVPGDRHPAAFGARRGRHGDRALGSGDGIGYLLESWVPNAAHLLDAVERVSEGGSVIDTELVREVLGARHRADPLEELTPANARYSR